MAPHSATVSEACPPDGLHPGARGAVAPAVACAGAAGAAQAGRPLRPQRPLSSAGLWARSYCAITPLHGLRYLALPRRRAIERSCWAAVLLAGTALGVWLVWITWAGFIRSPVLVTVETSQHPIWRIRFPAVTVCSLNVVENSSAEHIVATWALPPNATRAALLRDLQLLSMVGSIPSPGTLHSVFGDLQRLQAALDLNNVTVGALLYKMAPRCRDLLRSCRFKGRAVPCKQLFAATRTRHGVCCSFNYYGVRGGGPDDVLPRRSLQTRLGAVQAPDAGSEGERAAEHAAHTSACGASMGLEVLLSARSRRYYATSHASQGFKVLVHDTRDYPSSATPAWLLAPQRALWVSLTPQVFNTTARALRETPAVRRCARAGERHLPFLRAYTYHNCATECRRNQSLAYCHCVPVHYPRHELERACNLIDLKCLSEKNEALESLKSQEVVAAEKEQEKAAATGAVREEAAAAEVEEGTAAEAELPCGCQPECEHVAYVADVSEGILSRDVPASSINFFRLGRELRINHKDVRSIASGIGRPCNRVHGEVTDVENYSVLHVHFADLVGTVYRRDILYTWKRMLASLGGLLGLVLGFSLTAGFEVAYYFSLRVGCAWWQARGRQPTPGSAAATDLALRRLRPVPPPGPSAAAPAAEAEADLAGASQWSLWPARRAGPAWGAHN